MPDPRGNKQNRRMIHAWRSWMGRGLAAMPAIVLLVMLGPGCSPKAKEERYLRMANQFYDAGRYDEAEIEYGKVLQLDRRNAQAIGRLGMIYFDEGRFQQALPLLMVGSKLEETNLDVRLSLGRIYLAAGKLKEAQDAAGYVLDRRPDDELAPILLAEIAATPQEMEAVRQRLEHLSPPASKRAPIEVALGNLLVRQGDFKGADAAFKRASSIDPKYSPLYSGLGRLYLAQKDVKQAEQAFKMAADLSPARSPRRLQYAQFEIQNGNLEAGKKAYEEITQKTPDYVPAWMGLADIAASQRKFDESASYLKNILARDPQNFDALLLDARIKLAKGDIDKAKAELESLAGIYTNSPQIYCQLALAYLSDNETERAINSFNQALAKDPHFAEATLALAELRIRKGDPSAAIVSLKRLAQEQPKLAKAQLLLADAYRAQGNLDDALKVYQQLAEQYPESPEGPLLMGLVLAQQGRKEDARRAFGKALEAAPNYLPALEQLVNLDLQDKEYSTAFQRAEKQAERNPKAPEPLLLEAKVHLAQGNTNQAEGSLLKAIELQPDFRGAYLALAQIYVAAHENEKALGDLGQVLAKNSNDVPALMLTGMIRNEMKDYKGARDAYERLVAINHNLSPALNNLAYLYSERFGQLDKAYEMASRARDLRPYDAPTADTLGWILYQKRQYPRALVLLEESASKLPASTEVQYHLGMTHYMLGEEEPARVALQRAIQANADFPGSEDVKQSLSVLAIDPKTAGADARASLEKRVSQKPDDPIAQSRLAAIYERAGEMEKAANAYEASLKTSPDNVNVLLSLARVYSSRPDQTQKAFELAKTAHQLSPDDAEVSHTLGGLAGRTGDHKWALNLLESAARNKPGDPELLYDLAEVRYAMGEVSEAQQAMQNALQTNAAFSRAAEARRFLEVTGLATDASRAAAAANRIVEILKVSPNYVPALMAKGMMNEQKPDIAAAERDYEAVLKQLPDFAPAQKRLAVLYAEEPGKNPKAYEMASKAREALPRDAEVAKALGIAVYRQGDYARAVSLLKEGDGAGNGDAERAYYLGMAQYQLKQLPESKSALQRALSMNLRPDLADDARRVMAQLK